MTSRFIVSRRQTLQQLGLALGIAVLGSAANAVQVGNRRAKDVELAVAADRLIAHKHSAAVVGAHYLETVDGEGSAELLTRAIRKCMPADCGPIDAQTLLARIRSDFESGEVVNLRGWIISRTEARLCALYAV